MTGSDAEAAAVLGAGGGVELLEVESAALALRQIGEAMADGRAGFGGGGQVGSRLCARISGKRLEAAGAAVGAHFVAQNAAQPSAKLTAAFEAVEAGEEGDEGLLHQIVGVSFGHTPSARHAVEHRSVFSDHGRQHFRIVAAEGYQIREAGSEW